jgi:invasion protein IalB
MRQTTVVGIAAAAVAVVALAGGAYYFLKPAPARVARVAPLPANAPRYGNWTLIGCNGAARRCTLLTRVVTRQNQRVLLQMNVLRAGNGNSVMLVTLPPNIIIPAGVTLTPTGGTAVKGVVRVCRPQACSAVVPLNDALVKGMSGSNTTGLQFVAATGRAVNLNLATAGFGPGYGAWQAALPPLPAAAKTKTAEPESAAAEAHPAEASATKAALRKEGPAVPAQAAAPRSQPAR